MNENTILDDGEMYVDRSASLLNDVLYVGDGVTPLKNLKPIGQKPSMFASFGGLGVPNIRVGQEFKTGRLRDGKIEYSYIIQTSISSSANSPTTVEVPLSPPLPSDADMTSLQIENVNTVMSDTKQRYMLPIPTPSGALLATAVSLLPSSDDTTAFVAMRIRLGYAVVTTDNQVYATLTYTKTTEGQAVVIPTVPAGTIWPFFRSEPPEGWLVCDGSIVSLYDFLELAQLPGIGGNGDGTITLPDLRGEFLRGASTVQDVSNHQEDALQNIKSDDTAEVFWAASNKAAVQQPFVTRRVIAGYDIATVSNSAINMAAFGFDASLVARTADETRPINTAVLFCIKYVNTFQDDIILAGASKIWSTEEQLTGDTWLGKPTYRRVVQGNLGPAESTAVVLVSIPGATAIVKKYSQVQIGTSVYDDWTISILSTPNSWEIRGDIDSNGISLSAYWSGSTDYANAPVTVDIEYVK